MLNTIVLIFLVLPVAGYPKSNVTALAPVATYTSGAHGVVVWQVSLPDRFLIVYSHRTVRLTFSGNSFSRALVKRPDRHVINAAVRSRNSNLLRQIKKARRLPNERHAEIQGFSRFGYRVVWNLNPSYVPNDPERAVEALGAKVTITHGDCRWGWETKNFAATSSAVFKSHGRAYLGVVMYSMGADGDSPAVRVFRLPWKCE